MTTYSIRVNLTNETEHAAQAFAARFGEENLARILRDAGDWRDADSYLELVSRAAELVAPEILILG